MNEKIFKFYISILFFLMVVAIGVFINKNKSDRELEEDEKMGIKSIMIGNMFATYENIDRELKMEYFYELNNNATYQKIESEIGKPNGGIGLGDVRPYYEVGGQYVVMYFLVNEEGEYDKLCGMDLYTEEKYIGEIPLKNQP